MKILRHLTAADIFTIRSREMPPLETTGFSLALEQLGGTHPGNEEGKPCRKKSCTHFRPLHAQGKEQLEPEGQWGRENNRIRAWNHLNII